METLSDMEFFETEKFYFQNNYVCHKQVAFQLSHNLYSAEVQFTKKVQLEMINLQDAISPDYC